MVVAMTTGCSSFLFGLIRHGGLSRDHHPCDTRSVLQSDADDLGGIDYSDIEEVLILFVCRIKAKIILTFFHLIQYHRRLESRISGNLTERLLDCPSHNRYSLCPLPFELELIELLLR